jgi:hypothetical protein
MAGTIAKRGRPSYVPAPEDRVLVERLIGLLVPEETIAKLFLNPPINFKTLRRHFRAEINAGRERTRARNRALLLRAAENGHVGAMIYLSARIDPEFHRLGDDKVSQPMAGADGSDETVHIYMPPNYRDQPDTDDDDGPVIEGEAAGEGAAKFEVLRPSKR